MKIMPMSNMQKRYLVNTIHCKSLELNPLQSPVERTISVYLPPNYYKNPQTRYPVVYILHGYDGHAGNWILWPDLDLISWQPVKTLMKSVGTGLHLDEIPTYARLDSLMEQGELPPFIIVQPDASLHIKIQGGLKGLDGERGTKGSFYINSPYTGRYADEITTDVIQYIDANYRTFPDREYRVLMGGSMGGYGALCLGTKNSQLFSAIAALSPANITQNLVRWKLVSPYLAKLFGQKLAEKFGGQMLRDILETLDLIISAKNPLLPTLEIDTAGHLVHFDRNAMENWNRYDLNRVFETSCWGLQQMKFWISCDTDDEYGLAPNIAQLQQTLEELGFSPHVQVKRDPRTELSPHIFGIEFQIIPALKYCTSEWQINKFR